jgi:hypothetical protein
MEIKYYITNPIKRHSTDYSNNVFYCLVNKNKKAKLKVALKRYPITHSLNSVDEFLMFTN